MIYQISRDENEATIRQLANKYPKCFFEDPHQRVPLKKDIAADLQKNGFPAAYELIVSAVGWYMNHFAYQYALQAGAKRVDLDGIEVGTVTKQEYLNAQKKIKGDKEKLQEQKLGYLKMMMPLPQLANRISDDQIDQMRKVDAPPKSPPVKAASVLPAELQVSPELTPLYEALRAANNAISATPNGELRAALASAALGVVVKEAQRAIASFSSNQ